MDFEDKYIFCLLYLSDPFFVVAVCHAGLDLSEEAEPRWQQANQDPSAASISGAAQDQQQPAQYTHPSLFQRYRIGVCVSLNGTGTYLMTII